MKLPSMQQVVAEANRTATRFPFVLLCAVCGTIAALILTDREGTVQTSMYFPMLFASALGIPFLMAVAMAAEKWRWHRAKALGGQVVGIFLLIGYAVTIPMDYTHAPAIYSIRFSILLTGAVLLAMVSPYLKSGALNGFWQYNKTLYFRLFITALYAGVLYAGLAIALAALDNLFGVDVPGKRYFELYILIAGLFAPWFFLAGVPEELEALERVEEYPKGLRVFAQYILLTLVVVYLVILYAYLFKILIQWNWPKGWVSSLILGFSATAILALLLLHPIRDRVGNAWIHSAGRWLYIVLIPLIVVLFLAVSERIGDYGITESRYAGLALGVWLSAQSLYFLFSKAKSIKFTVGSLCVLAFLMIAGPWGMFGISERSQVDRLRGLLTENEILVEGKVQKVVAEIPLDDRQEISSIVEYLHDIHGYGGIQPWFAEPLTTTTGDGDGGNKWPGDVVRMMGFEYTLPMRWSPEGKMLQRDAAQAIEIAGYDKLVPPRAGYEPRPHEPQTNERLWYRLSANSDTLTFVLGDAGKAVDSAKVDLASWKRQVLEKYADSSGLDRVHIPVEDLAVTAEGDQFRVKAYLNGIHVGKKERDTTVNAYDLIVLYSTKEEE